MDIKSGYQALSAANKINNAKKSITKAFDGDPKEKKSSKSKKEKKDSSRKESRSKSGSSSKELKDDIE